MTPTQDLFVGLMAIVVGCVLIVGAGLSGVGAGYHLKQRCPDKSYVILENRDAIGGTWDLFRYPGIRSDSDMFSFGFQFRPWNELQTLADGIKLFFKEDFRPVTADRWTYGLAPIMAMVPSILAFAVIPVGDTVTVAGREIRLILADIEIGLLFFLAMGSIGEYGVVLAGWASGSKYPLLGGVRSTAQLISYEIALGLSLVPVALVAGTRSPWDIVAAQAGTVGEVTFFDGIPVLEQFQRIFQFAPSWFIWSQWPAAAIFLVAGIAETNRAPFDLPEAEQELVAGYHTEYGGMRWGLFQTAEYINMITLSALAVTLFFGGWEGPWAPLGPVWFLLKLAAVVFVFIWLRASLPRLRYDQLMAFGWKVLLPVATLNAVAAAFFVVLID